MALTLSAATIDQQNVLLTLNADDEGAIVRIAALQTANLVTLTAVNPAGTVSWGLFLNPSWLTLETNSTTNTAQVKFVSPSADTRLFQCYVKADDGVTQVYYPLAIEVLEPLSISVSGRTNNYLAYDSTATPVTLQALGLNGSPISNGQVSYITPVGLPGGLSLITADGNSASLQVAQPNINSISGGMAASSPATYDFLAFCPGTMYDSLTYPYDLSLVIGTLATKVGMLDAAMSCYFDNTQDYMVLNIQSDYLDGLGGGLAFNWNVSGTATGVITEGGTTTSSSMNWTPETAGTVQFQVAIQDSVTGNTISNLNFGPFQVGQATGTWTSTSAIKLQIDAPFKTGPAGSSVPFTVSVPTTPTTEFQAGETINVTVALVSANGEPSITPPTTFSLTSVAPSNTFDLVIPTSAQFKGKWTVVVTANNSLTSPTRTGQLSAVLLSTGLPTFSINNNAIITLSQVTGSSITPVSLVATNSGTLQPITDVKFSLVNAPPGLSIVNNQIVGAVPQVGSFNFQVLGTEPNYSNSFTNVSLVVTGSASPLTITSFGPAVTQTPDNIQFNVNWGVTGSPVTLMLQRNADVPLSVLNSVQSTQTIVGTSVYTLIGTDYRTSVYSIPSVVVSNSSVNATQLSGAPTIAEIDDSDLLTVIWNPLPVNNTYSLYSGWNIQLSNNGAIPVQLFNLTGLPPTGLEVSNTSNDSRLFTYQLANNDSYTMNMTALSSNRGAILDSNPWSNFLAFPGPIDNSLVGVSQSTLSIGQSLTITLSQSYAAADYWRITYSNGTNTGWLPISQKTQATTFSTPGSQAILVEFEYDYSTLTPPVYLRRSLTFSVFVQNQVYNSTTAGVIGTGNVGLGGEAGFEIASSSSSTYQPQPYMVIVKALVQDNMTQELKILVATSRTSNASSLLNTMSADVFPLVYRPNLKDLVIPALNFTSNLALVTPVSISTTALPTAIVGQPMQEIQLSATGGTAPYDWYSDSLPFGLHLSLDGTLSGTPLAVGVYNINFSVQDATSPAFIAEATVMLTIESDIAVQTVTPPAATVGAYYQSQLTATGGLPPYSWSVVDGALPLGLSLDAGSGLISGYPVTYNSNSDFVNQFVFVTEVVDSIGSYSSVSFQMWLLPMNLTLGNMDQTIISEGMDFKMAIPVFGGRSPYTISSFSSDSSIGNALSIISPEAVDVVSGLGTPPLTIMTGDQVFSPTAYPYVVSFPLSATGGVAPYVWSLDISVPALNTILSPIVSASLAGGTFLADGAYSIVAHVVDQTGASVSKVINLTSTLKGGSGGTGPSALEYVIINKNSSSYTTDWTFTPLSNLPDAQQGSPYLPPSLPGSFFGIAVWNPTSNQIYDLRTEATQIQFTNLYSTVGGAGQSNNSKFIVDATAAGLGSGLSGILQSLFSTSNSNLVDPTTGKPYPAQWQDIYDPIITVHQPNLPADQQVYTWSIGGATTIPYPTFTGINSAGETVVGPVVTTSTGTVTLVPTTLLTSKFTTPALAASNPYVLEIIATDTNSNAYSTNFAFYPVAGGTITSTQASGTTVVNEVFPGISLLTPSEAGAISSGAVAQSVTSQQSGITTPYFPMGVAYYQGDYSNLAHTQMRAADTAAVTPTQGVTTTALGSNPYTFIVLDDTGTPPSNSTISSLGNYTLGTVVTNNNLSKEMSVHCSVAGGGVGGTSTPVVTVTTVQGDTLNAAALGYQANTTYVNWFYILNATGGTAPYTFSLVNGTTFPGVTVHNNQTTTTFLSPTGTSAQTPYTGCFLLVNSLPTVSANSLNSTLNYMVQVQATDANGNQSTVATVPFTVIPMTTSSSGLAPALQALTNTLTGGPLWTGVSVTPLAQSITLSTNATWTLDSQLPAGLLLADPSGTILMHGTSISGGGNATAIYNQTIQLIGTPINTANVTVNLTATAPGYSAFTVAIPLTINPQTATINLTSGGQVQPNTAYSFAQGSPFVSLHVEGFLSTASPAPGLITNLGTLSNPVVVNVTNHYNSSYAQTYDLYYTFTTASVGGTGTFSIQNAGSLTGSASFVVSPPALTAQGNTVSFTVSEYTSANFIISTPPLSISGGTAPYGAVCTVVSNPTYFGINSNGQPFFNVAMGLPGNTYTTNITYQVADSSGTPLVTSVVATISVYVQSETMNTVQFVSTVHAFTVGQSVTYSTAECIHVQLGHQPFTWNVTSISMSSGASAFIKASPSNELLVVNNSAYPVTYQDYAPTDNITGLWNGGLQLSGQTGHSFTIPAYAGAPTAGVYTITLGITVTDSTGVSTSGTSIITLIVA